MIMIGGGDAVVGSVAPAVSSMEEALTLVRDAIKAEGAMNKVGRYWVGRLGR